MSVNKGRTDRYDIGRKQTGQSKDGIHWKNIYMCIGEGLKDRAHCRANHCLGVYDRIRYPTTAKTTLGELVLDQDNIVTQGNSWQSQR